MPQGIETLLSSPAPRYPTPVKRYGDQQENSFTFCTQNCGNQIQSMQQHPSPYNEIQPDIPSPRWTARISPGYLFSKNLHSAVKQNDCSDYNGKNLRDNADSDQSADWDYIRPYNTPFLLKFLTLPQVDKNRPKITTKEGKISL